MIFKNTKKIYLITLPLILGVFIYVFFRSRNLFYYNFFHILDLDENIREFRVILWRYRKSIPNWVLYSLPDGLWLYSFGIAFLYGSKFFFLDTLFFLGITLFMIAFEFFQLRFGGHGSLVGTFDINDIYCFIGGFFLSVLICFFSTKPPALKFLDQVKNFGLKALFYRIYLIFLFSILAVLPTFFKL